MPSTKLDKKSAVKKRLLSFFKTKPGKLIIVIGRFLGRPIVYIRGRHVAFIKRRPHRSLRKSNRADYVKPVKLPGYIALTTEVTKNLWKQRKIFGCLLVFVVLVFLGSLGISSVVRQDLYGTFNSALSDRETKQALVETFGGLGQAGLLFMATVSGGFAQGLSETQQMLAVAIILVVWLSVVWIWRNIMAGHKIRMRDGLYNAGAPILPTIAIAFVLIGQLVPLSLAIFGYMAASQSGLLVFGVDAMMFWMVAALLALISIYFFISTFFAVIIVTLPGMYPMRAIREAGDIVVGRRIKILLRLAWMAIVIFFSWVVVALPVIMFDIWLKQTWTSLNWLPLISIVAITMLAGSIIWAFSYIYFLYRKVIADATKTN